MRLAVGAAAAIAALVAGAPARAQTFPARTGETGLIDVPTADTMRLGLALFGAEYRYDSHAGRRAEFGPMPLYMGMGFTEHSEIGVSVREWGQPGDPLPARTVYGAAWKLQLKPPSRWRPGFAVDLNADRINADAVFGARAIASTSRSNPLSLAAFAGGELGAQNGVTVGGALAVALYQGEIVVEGLLGPRGASYGGAVRWKLNDAVGVSLGANYLPDDDGFRVSLGLGVGPPQKRATSPATRPPSRIAGAEAAPVVATLRGERPRFLLRMRSPDPTGTEPRPLRHAPWSAPTAVASTLPARPATTGPARAAAPSLDDLADAQLREQESLADSRERRIRTTGDQLEDRQKAATVEGKRLDDRERDLAGREQQLDIRESRVARGGVPTQQQRQLESLEAQLAAQERQLAAQERSLAPALDAAQGRDRDAAAREAAEGAEARRLSAAVSGAPNRSAQLDLRKQALGARNRQLAAMEARLVSTGERIDALERQLRVKTERLDAAARRLDTRSERLDLLEKRGQESQKAAPAPVKTAEPAKETAPKDAAAFVTVVKSPTAIVKEQGGRPAAAATGTGTAVQAGVAVEKAVAAATVVSFPSPATQLTELDRQGIEKIAKVASAESCEVLIWARAKDSASMVEAQRRADEIRGRIVAAGVADKLVVTRITVRPGAQGVDVVVSALRETAKKQAAPAAAGPSAPALQSGESGKRQIREAVVAAQASIERCVGAVLTKRKLDRAEGVLKLTVSAKGRVAKVVPSEGDLGGAAVGDCLTAASAEWLFPGADGDYVVDVPITIIRGGSTP